MEYNQTIQTLKTIQALYIYERFLLNGKGAAKSSDKQW